MRQRRASTVVKIALLALSTLASFVFLEIAARQIPGIPGTWVPLDGDDWPGFQGAVVWSKYAHHMPKPNSQYVTSLSEEDRIDGISAVPIRYNSLGIRGSEIGPKTKSRVLLMGDSVIEARQLPMPQIVGGLLNQGPFSVHGDVIQHGLNSWSPILEYSWFLHFHDKLSVDRVYLFVLDNDFVSAEANSKADVHYRKQFSFDAEGRPDRIEDYDSDSAILRNSYVARSLDAELVSIRTRIDLLVQLWNHPMSRREKVTRVVERFRYGKPLFYTTLPQERRASFDRYVVSKDFDWDNRQFVELLTLRSPESDWDALTEQSVRTTTQSIMDFSTYLRSKGIELTVVYVPLGIDVDPYECTACRKALSLRDGIFFDDHGLEEFLKRELNSVGVPLLKLLPALTDYKQQRCPDCTNFLYFGNDAHWTADGHKAVASALETDLLENPLPTLK